MIRFCAECKLKVLEAYHFLFNNHDNAYRNRKGFSSVLYQGMLNFLSEYKQTS